MIQQARPGRMPWKRSWGLSRHQVKSLCKGPPFLMQPLAGWLPEPGRQPWKTGNAH